MKPAAPETGDLTKQEQTNVRTAMRFLRARVGSWATLGKALKFGETTMSNVNAGNAVSPTMAGIIMSFGSRLSNVWCSPKVWPT